jgi:hypothetical protein
MTKLLHQREDNLMKAEKALITALGGMLSALAGDKTGFSLNEVVQSIITTTAIPVEFEGDLEGMRASFADVDARTAYKAFSDTDGELLVEAVGIDQGLLKDTTVKAWLADRTFVLNLVQKVGLDIFYKLDSKELEQLTSDEDFFRKGVQISPKIITYAPESMINDRSFMIELATGVSAVYKYLEQYKNDVAFLKEVYDEQEEPPYIWTQIDRGTPTWTGFVDSLELDDMDPQLKAIVVANKFKTERGVLGDLSNAEKYITKPDDAETINLRTMYPIIHALLQDPDTRKRLIEYYVSTKRYNAGGRDTLVELVRLNQTNEEKGIKLDEIPNDKQQQLEIMGIAAPLPPDESFTPKSPSKKVTNGHANGQLLLKDGVEA